MYANRLSHHLNKNSLRIACNDVKTEFIVALHMGAQIRNFPSSVQLDMSDAVISPTSHFAFLFR